MGLLVEIDISELVWDEQTDGSHQYACDRIDEFIDEISDQNKIIPHNFKEVDIDTPTILISLNNKLISYIRFNADEWDEDAMSLSLGLVLDFTSAEDIDTYFLTEHDNKYISSNQKKPEYYTNYNGDLEMRKLYNKAKSILVK